MESALALNHYLLVSGLLFALEKCKIFAPHGGMVVYAREGRQCPRCRRPIVREKISGRSTFYCQFCQV